MVLIAFGQLGVFLVRQPPLFAGMEVHGQLGEHLLHVDAVLEANQPSIGIGLEINPKYDSISREVKLFSHIKFQKVWSGSIEMASYLIEDKVRSWQTLYPTPSTKEEIETYEHNHILRAGLVPVSGNYSLSNQNQFMAGQSLKNRWIGSLPPGVVARNARIIFVLTNSATNEVVQVSESDYLIK